MSQVGKLVRDSIFTVMSAGFNANVSAALSSYGLDAGAIDWMGIDWGQNQPARNFMFGRIAPDVLEATDKMRYPFLSIDTFRSQSDPRFKYTLFGGRVAVVIDIHLSWKDAAPLADFSSWADAFEDALYTTLHDDTKFVGSNMIYNKDISVNRLPILAAGENWRQTISCPLTFTVITN